MYLPAGTVSQRHLAVDRRRPMLEGLAAWHPTPGLATVLIVATTAAFGFVAFFARSLTEAGMAPSAVAFYRYGLTAVATVWFTTLDPRHRAATAWAFATGLAMGGGWIAYVRAIEVGDVATVGLLYMTYPLFTVVTSAVLFRVRLSARAVLGAGLVVLAAAIVLVPGGGLRIDPVLFVALLAPLTFGFAIAVLTERLADLHLFQRIGPVCLGAVVGTLPLVLSLPADRVLPTDLRALVLVIGIGVGTSLVPMTVYAVAAPAVGGARSATAGAVELPVMFAIGWLIFGEALRPIQLLAAALILAAIAVSPVRGQRKNALADAGRHLARRG